MIIIITIGLVISTLSTVLDNSVRYQAITIGILINFRVAKFANPFCGFRVGLKEGLLGPPGY